MRVIRVFDFARVGRRHGGKTFAALDRPFHEVDATVIFHQITVLIGNTEQVFQNIERIFSLIFDIMNRKQCANILIFGTETVYRFEIERGKRCLPIVAMHDFGIKSDERHDFENAAAEEGKPFAVVVISVAAWTLEVIFVIDKVIFHVVERIFKNAAVLVPPGKRNEDIADKLDRKSVV